MCTAVNDQASSQITSDGAGGAIITWQDYRNGSDGDIYAQRVDASGIVMWATDGVAMRVAPFYEEMPQITSDGVGGAIITWRQRGVDSDRIIAQRVNASGSVMWGTNGVNVCGAPWDRYGPQIISDGVGGAIITWEDHRDDSGDIYAQRVDASGTKMWPGVAICTATGQQSGPEITSDGVGGAIITWEDYRSGSADIYAQDVDLSGAAKWTGDGVVICAATDGQYYPELVSDGAGGAIITWFDNRIGISNDIYAQRVDASGAVKWAADGVAICTAIYSQVYPRLVSDGAGGATITWQDLRNGSNYDIYAQHVPAGIADVPLTSVTASALSQNVPNPFNPLTRVTFEVAAPSEVRLLICDIAGRPVRTLVDAWREPGVYSEVWDGRDGAGSALPSGVYFYRLEAGDFVATRKMVLLR
jgi:hypothetical protein